MNIKRVNIILGKTGTGKSFLIKKNLNNFNNTIIIDVMNEYESDNFFIVKDYYSFLLALKDNINNIIVKTSNRYEISKILNFIFKYLQNKLIVLEEAYLYLDNSIDNFINFGRHKNIFLILIARRGLELNRYLPLVEKVFLFKTTSDYDLVYYQRMFGINKSDLIKLKNLSLGEFLEFDI